jgi:hypothetical protein
MNGQRCVYTTHGDLSLANRDSLSTAQHKGERTRTAGTAAALLCRLPNVRSASAAWQCAAHVRAPIALRCGILHAPAACADAPARRSGTDTTWQALR